MPDVVPIKIRAIKRAPAQPVYDIQVKKNHNFFANGLLVHNCIIFQEQVMELAEKVAGFPKDKCDEVRRAIMKRSISGGEAAKKAAQETRDSFVKGCIDNGYSEKVANNLYDKILYFAGYGFNKAHAVAYAIDSYWCAWLMTYHEEEWLTAYMESMSGSPEKRAKAFSEVRALGYQIVPIDINHAKSSWTVLPGKKLMPSFLSCKGVGVSAIQEIMQNRPYRSIEDLLWDENNEWRHSKFNKKALEALIKVGALDSLDLVGEGKPFSSYHHMYEVVIENQDLIKKTSKKDPLIGKKNFYELSRKLRGEVDEWSRKELAEFKVEYFGTLDVLTMIDPQMLANLERKDVIPIDDIELGETKICWFVIAGATVKKTKNGKQYLQLQALGPVGKAHTLNVWGWKDGMTFAEYELCFAEVSRNEFGCSTTSWKLKSIG